MYKFPVDVWRIVYNFMYGYHPLIHIPEEIITKFNHAGLDWILRHRKWSSDQLQKALIQAIKVNNVEGARRLLKGVYKNQVAKLELALTYERIEIAELLIKTGTNIQDLEMSPIYSESMMIYRGAMIRFLITHGYPLNPRRLFRMAVSAGCYDTAQILIERGADVRQDNDWALVCASWCGNLKMVRLLAEHGADVHARNDAAINGTLSYDVFKFLLSKGATPTNPHIDSLIN